MTREFGRFVWFELMSNDQQKAKAFYPELFGWSLEPMTMADKSTYPLLKVGDTPIGGLAVSPPAEAPTHWVPSVSVDDVDGVAKKVLAAGGKTLMDAMEMTGVGRLQAVADPGGAPLILFRGATGDPPRATGVGSVHWNELWAKDAQTSLKFYKEVFGYQHETMDMPTGAYHVLKSGDDMRGGLMQAPDPNMPPMWLQYIEVANRDDTLKQALSRGATQLGEAMEVANIGRFAILQDPLGGVIGVIEPAAT